MGEQNIQIGRPSPVPEQQQPPAKASDHAPPISVSSAPAEAIQHTKNSSLKHRHLSPVTSCADTPRSKNAETGSAARATSSQPSRPGGCVHETALVRGRRRMPYSLGIEKLQRVNPTQVRPILPEHEGRLTKDMRQLFDNLLPTQDVAENRKRFVQKLEKIFKDEWPEHNIQINVFGSLGNMLCSDYSEVDICVTTDWKELENVCMIAKLLAKRGMDNVVCVPAKVPIVKIRDPELNIACHINVNNTLALETTRMIWTYVNIDTRVRPLAMIIKYWARRRMINDAAFGGTLSSYTWICMVIGFLQMQEPPVLPVLHQRPDDRRDTPNGSTSEFADDLDKLRGFGEKNKQTLGKLLHSFFKFYGYEFNYSMDALSIRLGSVIPKTKRWLRTVNNLLCIEEPFNIARNLANSADDISFRGLHLELRRAFDLISQAKLDECCEQYVFPKEEEKIWQKPVQFPRPVIIRDLSQQPSSRRRTRGSDTSKRSSSNLMLQNPIYYQASMQPGNWQYSGMQPILDPGTLSVLQALQMQEQTLRFQLTQQQISYGSPTTLTGDQLVVTDPFYVPQRPLSNPEMFVVGAPVMQPYLPPSGVNNTWPQPQAAMQTPPVHSISHPLNSYIKPQQSNTSNTPSVLPSVLPPVAGAPSPSGRPSAVSGFVPNENVGIELPITAKPPFRDANTIAMPSFIIDEDEETQTDGKPEARAANAEASNPSINLLQLLAARMTARKPTPKAVASSAALGNLENESTPNNPKTEEPMADITSAKPSELPNGTAPPGSTIGPQDTITISIGPSHDVTHGTITSFRTKTTSLTLPTSATQTKSQGTELKAEPAHEALEQTQIDKEELELPRLSKHTDGQNIQSDAIAIASTISADSMQLTPAQKINIVRRFSGMVSGRLAGLLSIDATSPLSNIGFLSQLEDLLKEFSNVVRSDTSNRAHSLGCKSIRVLRREIARELERMLSCEGQLPEAVRHLPYIASEAERVYAGQMTFSEKVDGWVDSEVLPCDLSQYDKTTLKIAGQKLGNVDNDSATILEPASMDSISISASSDTSSFDVPGLYPDFINDGDISTFLANHAAFDDLVANVQLLLEKYHCNKMDLIRHRVVDAVQRYQVQLGAGLSNNHHMARFHVDWNIREFLETQYADGIDQNLGLSLTFVGQLVNAQLTTIQDYFERVWPRYACAVLNPLMRKLRGLNGCSDTLQQSDGTVAVGFDETDFTATGSEAFIVAVAQQLSWLAANCRASESGLAYSHVDFINTLQGGSTGHDTVFHIQVSVETPASAEQRGCWNTLAGNSVLVAGFPIPGRHHAERGLQSHLGILSSLVGIRQTVTYRGGYVLKGRFHALVPIEREADSVQWHLIDTSPRKLRWADIDKLCPTRVLGTEYKDLKALQAAKAFLGWCPTVKNILGTKAFEYTAVRYSKATMSTKTRLNLSEFSFGVNKIVSASVKFTLGRKDGVYERERSDYYEGILNDARDTHMFLYDSKNRRAFHGDAERVILQILLHAHNKSPYTVDGKPVCLGDLGTTLDEDAVRQTMLANANIILRQETRPKDGEPIKLLFRDKVQQLYDTIHGFQGHQASNSTAISIESSTTILGWEYMDLVSDKRSMKLKEIKLQKTCGHWPSFVTDEDINGVVLLGQDFGDILQPVDASLTCTSYKTVPVGNDYLAVQSSTLIDLFDEHGSAEDQQQLTSSGWTWHCPSLLFGACHSPSSEVDACRCDRVQEFILPRSRLDPRQLLQPKIRRPGPLEEDGAVIFGASGIKNSVIKRIGLIGRKSGTAQDLTASEVTIAATSSSTAVESIEKDDALPNVWTKSGTAPENPNCSPVSRWSVPEPGILAAYADSLCGSEFTSSSDASHMTIFSTSGFNSGAPISNSTSIPEKSERGMKTSGTSFTRPGLSFAAVAAIPSYSLARYTTEKSPKLAFSPVAEPAKFHPHAERRSLHKDTSGQSLSTHTSATSQPPRTRQLPHQLETGNKRERVDIGNLRDINSEEALGRPAAVLDHISTMAWRHLLGDDDLNLKAQNASKEAGLELTGACRQVLRRKRNFIRTVAN